MKRDKKSKIKKDILVYFRDDFMVFKTPDNKYYIIYNRKTSNNEFFDNLEQAIRAAIEK